MATNANNTSFVDQGDIDCAGDKASTEVATNSDNVSW